VSLAVTLSAGAVVTGSPMYLAVPLIAAACHAVAVIILWTEVRPLSA
jgi:hypothetical protein